MLKLDAVSGGDSPHSYFCISYMILLFMNEMAPPPDVLVVMVVFV